MKKNKYVGKFTFRDAETIRAEHRQGASVSDLSRKYKVAYTTIKNIVMGWSHTYRLTVSIPPDLIDRLETRASKDKLSEPQVLIQALRIYLR